MKCPKFSRIHDNNYDYAHWGNSRIRSSDSNPRYKISKERRKNLLWVNAITYRGLIIFHFKEIK
jgi:hypothetical protein